MPRALVISLLLAAVMAAGSPAGGASIRQVGAWRLDTPLGRAAGPFLLVADAETAHWRLELALDGDGPRHRLEDLQARRGRGWTICGGDGAAFVQGWNERWHEVGSGTAGALAALAGAVAGQRTTGDSRVVLPTWDDMPAAWRPPGRRPQPGHRLRRQLTLRGLGAGGDGLVLSWRETIDGLEFTTTRWPVRVVMATLATDQELDLPAEAYLPLWPLAEFLR